MIKKSHSYFILIGNVILFLIGYINEDVKVLLISCLEY